jgi:N-acetylglucosamine-6-phosphate deacetylase
LISGSPETIALALDAVDAAIAAGIPGVVGVHIEGPFIAHERKGIHAEARLRSLDDAMLDVLTRPRQGVVMLTLAPELATDDDIARLVGAGVVLSAGHTDATLAEAERGFAAGISGVTHLFNAMSLFHHRAPGMVGAALDDDRIFCGLIPDGVHVAPAAIRIAARIKRAQRLMLVTDAMPGVGNGGQAFRLDGREIFVNDGICTDAQGTLAGSGLDMATALRNMVRFTGFDVPELALMASATPAEFLGLSHDRGTLAVGKRADFVICTADLHPRQTWIGGECRFAAEAAQ